MGGAAAAFLLAVALAVTDWVGVASGRRALRVVGKPGTMVALIAAALLLDPSPAAGSSVRAWFVVALVLSLAGDVLLLLDRSSSMKSGRSFGRHRISTSAIRCDTTPPCDLTPGEAASPLKWIGMWMRIFSFSRTRCMSTCWMALRAGCICRSLTIAACFLSPTTARTLALAISELGGEFE